MKKKSFILFFLFFSKVFFVCCTAQEKGFLTSFSEDNHSWFVTDAIETAKGDFVICSYDSWGDESMLLKLSSEGEVIAKVTIAAEDTTVYAYRILKVPEENGGEYEVLCLCNPVDGSTASLLFLRVDEGLNATFRRTIPCSMFDDGSSFYDAEFLLSGTSIYGALTSKLTSAPNAVFLTRFDFDGNLLNSQRLDFVGSLCNLFQAGEDRVGLFRMFSLSCMGFMTFDTSLQLIGTDTISSWSTPEGGNGDFCLYNIMDMINSQAAMLPNGSYFISARLTENLFHANDYHNDRSAVLAKYDDSFHQPEKMLVTGHMNDSLEYPAFFRSMDFKETVNEGFNVFQCSILNELPQYGFLQQPYPTGIVVTKTDQDLNIEWKKHYLRDGNYQAMAINATSDGGCLVVGSMGDYQAQRFDVFALKINADGTVGLDEIQEESMAFVYPNPANETFTIGGVEAKETQVYNTLGQRIMTFRGNVANVDALSEGVYLLRVTDGDGLTQTLRLIVNK